MMLRQWIKEAQRAGWLVRSSSGGILELQCAAHGCEGRKVLPLDNLGPAPASCDLDHINGHSPALWDEYKGLVDQMRQRRRALGLDQIDLNNAMGMTDGYVNKLESMARIPRPAILQLWAQTLGLRLVVVPDQLPPATLKAIDDRQAKPYAENQARFKHAG